MEVKTKLIKKIIIKFMIFFKNKKLIKNKCNNKETNKLLESLKN